MNRMKRTFIEIILIITIFYILGIIVYFLGGALAKSFLKASELHSKWMDGYFSMTLIIMHISLGMTLVWYFLARFAFKIREPFMVGKRLIWCLLGFFNISLCLIIPATVFADVHKNYSIYLLLFGLFGLLGFYIGSVFATPAPYKYTPIGAQYIRSVRSKIGVVKEGNL